jgi:putative tryptophan/tyrosine transport system substrate-binding protein
MILLLRCHLARLSFVLLSCSLLCAGLARAAPVINVLVAEPTGIYLETANSLTQALGREGWKVTVTSPGRNPASGGDLTVAIGTKALEAALAQPGRPVLSLLVPQLTYERLASGQQQVSALYLDQPLTRQLRLLGLALPGMKKAGVPLGPASQGLQVALQNAAKDSGIQVNSAPINQGSDMYAVLIDLAEDSQAFLLLPDPVATQRSTLQNFFLQTYRLKKPVLAYSAPLVQSGALLALYATPAQLGEEAAAWIRESWSKGVFRMGEARYPKRFTIGVNHTVARSLDIALPSEAALTRQLEAMP